MTEKGKLYGVGVGPGDPKLMTLRAAEVIRDCRVIAAPRTPGGGMVALDIVKGAADLSGKTIVPLDFAMSPDPAVRAASHEKAAALLRPHLDAGVPVAMLNLGDVSIFASYRYISDILEPLGYPTEMIPGVTSFCAAAAALGVHLTDIDTPLHIIPDGAGDRDRPVLPGTSVWMKSGKHFPDLLQTLDEHGLLDRAMLVQNCGMEGETVLHTLRDAKVENKYFTIVIVKNGAKGQP